MLVLFNLKSNLIFPVFSYFKVSKQYPTFPKIVYINYLPCQAFDRTIEINMCRVKYNF